MLSLVTILRAISLFRVLIVLVFLCVVLSVPPNGSPTQALRLHMQFSLDKEESAWFSFRCERWWCGGVLVLVFCTLNAYAHALIPSGRDGAPDLMPVRILERIISRSGTYL